MKYDPESFDNEMVNRFLNASMAIKILGNDAKTVPMDHLVDPYNPQDFARAVVEKIQQVDVKDNKEFLKQLIKEFSEEKK